MSNKHNIVIYHANCPDGFGAALAAWLKLGDSAEYLPYQYGMAPPEVADKSVFIVDFSFDRPTMEAMDKVAHKVVLLDHHKTAIDKLEGYECRCKQPLLFRDITTTMLDLGMEARVMPYMSNCSLTKLDMTKSGARLAWEYFHGADDIPELIRYIEDRDLWAWRYGDTTKHYLAKLDSLPRDFFAWAWVLRMSPAERASFMAAGAAMCEKFESLVAAICDHAVPVTLLGHEGLMVNAPTEFASDVGHVLASRCGTFAVVWNHEKAGNLKLSLRSVDSFDVRVLAEQLDGGGHPQAAAVRLPASRFSDIARGVIELA